MDTIEQIGAEPSSGQILHPGSRKLFSIWEATRSERAYPRREDLEMVGMSEIMPDLVIIERDNLRQTFRYRLAGTRVCQLFGHNLTTTDALAGWDNFEANVIRKHFGETLADFQPTLIRMRLQTDTDQTVAVEFLGLPVQARGSDRMQIMGGLFTFRPVSRLGHNAIKSRDLLAIRSIWTEHRNAENKPRNPPRPFRVIDGGLRATS